MSLNPRGRDLRSLLGDPDARQQPRPRPYGSHGPVSGNREGANVLVLLGGQFLCLNAQTVSSLCHMHGSKAISDQWSGSKWFPSISRVLGGTADLLVPASLPISRSLNRAIHGTISSWQSRSNRQSENSYRERTPRSPLDTKRAVQ